MKNARNIGDAPIGRVEEAALKGGGCEAKPPGGACRGPQMRQAVSCNAGRICAPPVWARACEQPPRPRSRLLPMAAVSCRWASRHERLPRGSVKGFPYSIRRAHERP